MKPTSLIIFFLILLPLFFGCSKNESPKNYSNKDEITTKQHDKGSIVISTNENSFLVVETYPPNLQEGDRYSAFNYKYANSSNSLNIGQRVEVESKGSISESYPGKGIAKNVKILSDYKPIGARLSESEILRKAIKIAEKKGNFVPGFRFINFDKKKANGLLGYCKMGKLMN